jgi:hypothetical protein
MTEVLPELAVRPGYLPPDDLPRGECITTSLPGGGIRVDRADPRVLISAELLDAMVDGASPGCWVDLAGCCTYDGALLKIRAVNRTVIYRIITYVPSVRGYIGEWPE